MDDTMEDAHGEEESPQMSDDDDDVMAQMATPPEMPIVENNDDDDDDDEEDDEDDDDDEAEQAREAEAEAETDAAIQQEDQDDDPDVQIAEDQNDDTEQTRPKPPSSSYLLTRSIPQPRWTINELRAATMQIAYMRQRLFDVKGPIELKADEFEYYFPFVDNVWVRQHKSRPSGPQPGSVKGSVRTDYYACRLQRPTYQPRKPPASGDGKPLRKKKTREGGTCKVRLRAIHYEGGVHAVTISRVGDHEHSHFLEDMDKMKRNSVVMDIARSEVMKGYSPASVYNVMNLEAANLAILGGKYMTRSDVRNSSQAWRASYKGDLRGHPGYTANDPIGPTLAPKSTPAYSAMPPAAPAPRAMVPVLPPNALAFNPAMQPIFEPYLPRYDSNIIAGQLPHVTLTYATSLDSFLALGPGLQTHLSGPITKAMTHYLRSRHDAILVGVGTALCDNPTLNCRLVGAGGYGGLGWAMHPRPIIIDPLARWSLDPKSTNVLRAAQEGRGRAPWVIVAPGFHLDPHRSEMLKYFGGKYLGLADLDPRYPLRPRLKWEAIFRALAGEGIRSVMVEGGGGVINDLLSLENRRLVSSLVLTIAPTYMGMGGVVVCPNRTFETDGRPRPVARFNDVRWQPMGEDVVMLGRFAPEGGDQLRVVNQPQRRPLAPPPPPPPQQQPQQDDQNQQAQQTGQQGTAAQARGSAPQANMTQGNNNVKEDDDDTTSANAGSTGTDAANNAAANNAAGHGAGNGTPNGRGGAGKPRVGRPPTVKITPRFVQQ